MVDKTFCNKCGKEIGEDEESHVLEGSDFADSRIEFCGDCFEKFKAWLKER